MAAVTPERKAKYDSLVAKYPKRKVSLVVLKDGREFWILSPTRTAWHQFKDAVQDSKRKRASMENLAATNCVDPEGGKLQDMFELEPALAETIAVKVTELAGFDDEAETVDFQTA